MLNLELSASLTKQQVFASIDQKLSELDLTVAAHDFSRPWGGFFVIDESLSPRFIQLFFPHLNPADLVIGGKLSPKILVVAPHQRLSWQYHFRRAEIWKLVSGVAGVVISETDEQGDAKTLALGEIVKLRQGQRHRLVGLNGWGVVAEIWQHTDGSHPSNEDDIVRLQDDFGR